MKVESAEPVELGRIEQLDRWTARDVDAREVVAERTLGGLGQQQFTEPPLGQRQHPLDDEPALGDDWLRIPGREFAEHARAHEPIHERGVARQVHCSQSLR